MSLKAVDMVVDSCLQSGASFASFYESLGIQEFMDKEHNGVLQGGKRLRTLVGFQELRAHPTDGAHTVNRVPVLSVSDLIGTPQGF